MEKKMMHFFLNNFNPGKSKRGSAMIVSGLLAMGLGLLIIFIPEILIAFVAFLFIASGLALFSWGMNIKRFQKQFQHVEIHIEE
jgi:hypothetical protein